MICLRSSCNTFAGRAKLRRPRMGIGHCAMTEVSQEIHTSETAPLYLVWFVLDTTAKSNDNPASCLLRARGNLQFCLLRPLGEATCNICRAGPCSVLIRIAQRAGIGCALICKGPTRGWISAQAAEAPCRRFLRRSDRGCV